MPLFPHPFFHYCYHLYLLHLTSSQQGKCHLGILPHLPHRFFILVIFNIIYTFLYINRGSVIWSFCLFYLIIFIILVIFSIIYSILHLNRRSFIWVLFFTYIHNSRRCDLGEYCFPLFVLLCSIFSYS